jgi:hypothetical protein
VLLLLPPPPPPPIVLLLLLSAPCREACSFLASDTASRVDRSSCCGQRRGTHTVTPVIRLTTLFATCCFTTLLKPGRTAP